MAVKVSGAVLASLFYDHSSSNGDQCGFLIGESVQQVKDTISDSQINNVEVETKIYVFDCVPCQRDLYYKSPSEITSQHIIDLLPDRYQNIIGWYSFRRNSTLRPSLRERLFHCNLASITSLDPNGLLFFLCTAKSSTNKSTHTFDHSFLHLDKNVFKKIAVDIINLGDTTHSDYLTIPSHTVSSRHGAFSGIINQQEKEFLDSRGEVEVNRIQTLNKAISRQLQRISKDIIDSESRCSELESEVSRLRSRAKFRILENEQQMTNHQNKNIAQETQGPSVDEILSMDQADNTSMEALLDQASTKPTDDVIVDSGTDANIEKMDTGFEHVPLNVIGNRSLPSRQKNSEFTHKRSSSNPPDIENISYKSSHSKSNEVVGETVHSPNVKSSDPFSYVGDMLAAESKKSSIKPSKVLKSANTGLDDIILHTGKNMSDIDSGSTNIGGVKLKSKIDRAGSPQSAFQSENQSISENRANDYRTKSTKKNCGQEACKTSAIEVDSSEDSASTEMDLTSSPVY